MQEADGFKDLQEAMARSQDAMAALTDAMDNLRKQDRLEDRKRLQRQRREAFNRR